MQTVAQAHTQIHGEFINLNGERFYAINNVDQMPPFFMTLVSESDHWMFISSSTGLTAGRVSPATALFTYETVDRIHDSHLHTGCKTLIRTSLDGSPVCWDPFNQEHDGRFHLSRNLYKNVLGSKICFEEVNHTLGLTYRYTWASSDEYGFVRFCELENTTDARIDVELIDGFQNVLPAGTPRFTQTNSSNLVDAYKWTELEQTSGLGIFSLFSAITDRAEPCESLNANTVFCLGLEDKRVLLSTNQIDAFKQGQTLQQETLIKGIRGAYLVNTKLSLKPSSQKTWQFVTNIEQSQNQVVSLLNALTQSQALARAIDKSVASGDDNLARKMAAADGFQQTNEEQVSAHHYANVLFNVLRGGIFDDQYHIDSKDYVKTIKHFNSATYYKHSRWLNTLPARIELSELQHQVNAQKCYQLERLTMEYLPITFGRRHGDPSRPWNQFEIKLRDENNEKILSYQGNWRDIFQNWEALTYSYPQYIESVISKFVNASTIDGYNPYRITKEGIDWEVEDLDDPWSYIGYWGDHQIIYLLKLLELSHQFHPNKLTQMLRKDIFCYANVPYRIKSFEEIKQNAKSTVRYDQELAQTIETQVESLGADGKLVLDTTGSVYHVNLLEKLCVSLLAKLGNLILGGGIWLNTQRPEWNDANNALVGQGISVVTLCYMRRYTAFLIDLLANEQGDVALSDEVATWIAGTSDILSNAAMYIQSGIVTAQTQLLISNQLGELSSWYRQTVYAKQGFSGKSNVSVDAIVDMLQHAQKVIDYTLSENEMASGMYHAYNLLSLDDDSISVDNLYPMLEGQVAALSSGYLSAAQATNVLNALFASDIYRVDQQTFMLYPDRQLPSFLNKNVVDEAKAKANPLVHALVSASNTSVIAQDDNGDFRFNSTLVNKDHLIAALDALPSSYAPLIDAHKSALLSLYEEVFNHKAFTGRSGGMFGFEGLGSIYWHMVSKLLLAVQECYFDAVKHNESSNQIQQLANHYYRVREGIGFNKTPQEYGAFPVDPYSHTPKHSGAQQPGMTGQVKEEVLTRFGELGIRVNAGAVSFEPSLLRSCEFCDEAQSFTYLDVNDQWQTIKLPPHSLAFTWCQVPFVYTLTDKSGLIVSSKNSEQTFEQAQLSTELAHSLFQRDGSISAVTLHINKQDLLTLP
ncbi:hypothetical protein [Thalassotalea agarivorans]|uniref:Cellobiose phosphorylase n=1 Tax=Thalassotalea agarivorans TaxID=349064 RepID=A0A1I0DQ44_THASX|nr:hypothetical protein [Thalassotalea agarivorans]SET34366.1 hypothetical protein SAMN05660429_01605 [Thalassotalea agarivorans]